MRSFPPRPDIGDSHTSGDPHTPDDLLKGHLWLLELIDGTGLRFQMDDSGLVRFGDADRVYEPSETVPLPLRSAVRHVRDRFNREALRNSVEDPSGVVFFGVATHYRSIDYDWDRLPPFLGTEVWVESSGSAESSESSGGKSGAFRPPDAVAAIFDGVGLAAVNAVEREVNARDFDPDAYSVPESAWYDGPAAGVVVRNKRGGRGILVGRSLDEEESRGEADIDDEGPTALAERYVTENRLERVADAIERRGEPVRVDTLADRIVEAIARETPIQFGGTSGTSVDANRFRTAVVERARIFLDERADEW